MTKAEFNDICENCFADIGGKAVIEIENETENAKLSNAEMAGMVFLKCLRTNFEITEEILSQIISFDEENIK